MNYARAIRGNIADASTGESRATTQAVVRDPVHLQDEKYDEPQSSQLLWRRRPPVIPTDRHSVKATEGSTDPSINPRYLGNPTLERNRSADIPDEKNCRLWITGLPPDCTVSDLLGAIRDVGPVYASYVVPPPDKDNKHGRSIRTSAASLTFFDESAANRLLLKHSVHRFTVGGYITTVSRHRIRTEAVPVGRKSRVLVIRGNPEVVRPENLARLCSDVWNIRYDTDFMEYRPGKESNEIVWAFGSYRAQAQAVYWALDKPWDGLSKEEAETVTVNFAPDPCG
ncbi:hypothetical protein F5Y13DRAFT_8030 [Hypoxylon sp. FL1857]|nr:hypothetical protein F5Y13DRAFT_8030 [Hypoxylon sp. FL1857]